MNIADLPENAEIILNCEVGEDIKVKRIEDDIFVLEQLGPDNQIHVRQKRSKCTS